MSLLLDALDRTLVEPSCARRWHTLLGVWRESTDDAARRAVVAALKSMADGDARADVLRLTFLAGTTGQGRFDDAAAVRMLAIEATDPDRLAAFMAWQWLNALQELDGRAAFTATLSARQLPEMARRLMQAAARLLPPELPPRVADEVQRVAIVVPYVGNQFHTPSVMAMEQGAVLAREGRQVHIFSAQELTPPDAPLVFGDARELRLPPLDMKALAAVLPSGVRLTVGDRRFSLAGRWRNLMAPLAQFDPDVVLLVGLFSPLAAALHAMRPVVGMSVNSVPPIAPLDVVLTARPQAEQTDIWGGRFPLPKVVSHPYRVSHAEKSWPITRAELGLEESAVVWITAGFRLEREIKGEWASRMLELMARYPDVAWLLVGGEGRVPPALLQAAPGRVRALPTRNDLAGIHRISDICVNPPRMGGGFSVAEAMAEGLPVTSFADSDGGDKVGDLALPDMDAYMERLAALTEDPALRAGTGATLRRRFAERYDLAASGPALVEACRQAVALARGRLTKPS